MITSAKQLIDQGFEGKWLKLSAEEAAAVVESIPGENLVRGTRGDANALRHYQDRGYIVVHGMAGAAEKHPLDEVATAPEQKITGGTVSQ